MYVASFNRMVPENFVHPPRFLSGDNSDESCAIKVDVIPPDARGSPCGPSGGFNVSTPSGSQVVCNNFANSYSSYQDTNTAYVDNSYAIAGASPPLPAGGVTNDPLAGQRKAGRRHHHHHHGWDCGCNDCRKKRGLTIVNEQVAGPNAQGGDFGRNFSDNRFNRNGRGFGPGGFGGGFGFGGGLGWGGGGGWRRGW